MGNIPFDGIDLCQHRRSCRIVVELVINSIDPCHKATVHMVAIEVSLKTADSVQQRSRLFTAVGICLNCRKLVLNRLGDSR